AMLELSPSIESDLDALIDKESLMRVKGAVTKLVEVETAYGEDIKDSVSTALDMILREDEEDKEYEEITYKTGYTPVPEFERNRIVFGAPGTGKSYRLKEDCD